MAADFQMQDIKEEALAKIQEITGIIPGSFLYLSLTHTKEFLKCKTRYQKVQVAYLIVQRNYHIIKRKQI